MQEGAGVHWGAAGQPLRNPNTISVLTVDPPTPQPLPHPTPRNHPDLMKGYPEVVEFYEYWE